MTTVLLLFLGKSARRSSSPPVIPLSMLFGFLGMRVFGVSANLMSLGAIDFGMIVDGAVVMIENSVHRLEAEAGDESAAIGPARRSGSGAADTFGVVIIIAVYLPILFLQGLEGRMFRPMAITVCSALFGSLILALTAVPTLSSYLAEVKAAHRQNFSERWFGGVDARAYARSLECSQHRQGILRRACASSWSRRRSSP